MFKSKTVFIVGSGASVEAGLPAGEELKTQIARLLDIRFEDGWHQNSGDPQITEALRESVQLLDGRRGDINPLLHKAWRIRDVVPAAAISIDNYLDAHQGDGETELCGKLAIVKAILVAEGKSKLKSKERGDHNFDLKQLYGTWYTRFFQMLTENVRRDQVDKIFDNISIITFNYDRCIERFLAQAVADYYNMDTDSAERLVGSKLRIYHPFGQIGPLHWQDRATAVPFGSERANLLVLAKQIKTFAEGQHDKELMAQIHGEISESDTLVFLGFAFHPLNMKLLTPQTEAFPRRIFATTFGLSDTDEQVIEDDIWRMLGRREIEFGVQISSKPEMAKVTCSDFFQRYFRSLSASSDSELPVTHTLPESLQFRSPF